MRAVFPVLILLMSACQSDVQLGTTHLNSLKGKTETIDPTKNAITVIYFLSPECPLCMNYSGAIKDLYDRFANDSVRFYGIFSSEWYSERDVEEFRLKYKPGIELYFETDNRLSRTLGATVTPEVFVMDRTGTIRYSGKIDNWVNQLGKKKLMVSENYLQNALISLQYGKAIDPDHTEAVGCLIE